MLQMHPSGVAAIAVLVGFVALVGCQNNPAQVPTEEQARAVLEEAFRRSQDGQAALCDWEDTSRLRCEDEFAEAGGPPAVPTEPPTIEDSCGFPADADNAAYRVMLLTGRDGRGQRYQTDVVVRDGGSYGFVPDSPVFWSGVGFAQGDTTGGGNFSCPAN